MGRHSWRKLTKPDNVRMVGVLVVAVAMLSVSAVGIYAQSQAQPAPAPLCNSRCQGAMQDLYTSHPSLNSSNSQFLKTTLVNGSQQTVKYVDIQDLFATHAVANSVDLLQPDALKGLGYGIVQINFQDGHQLYLGCLNSGARGEECRKAAYSDHQLWLQQAVTLVGYINGQ